VHEYSDLSLLGAAPPPALGGGRLLGTAPLRPPALGRLPLGGSLPAGCATTPLRCHGEWYSFLYVGRSSQPEIEIMHDAHSEAMAYEGF
jgi:hypothetical protein